MDLYEYQARDLFEKHGVPTLRGIVATSAVQAEEAAAKLGTPIVVVKAQVKTGGRGKAASSAWTAEVATMPRSVGTPCFSKRSLA